jgi:hypothetical protein
MALSPAMGRKPGAKLFKTETLMSGPGAKPILSLKTNMGLCDLLII